MRSAARLMFCTRVKISPTTGRAVERKRSEMFIGLIAVSCHTPEIGGLA